MLYCTTHRGQWNHKWSLCVLIVSKDKEEEQPYVNEHEKLVFGDLLCYTDYILGLFELSYSLEYGKYCICHSSKVRPSSEPLHSQVRRWISSSSSRKGDLLNRYAAIIFCLERLGYNGDVTQPRTRAFDRRQFQPPQYQLNGRSDSVYGPPHQKTLYAPGSILTDPLSPLVPNTLVGRVRPEGNWDVCLIKLPLGEGVVELSFDKFVIQLTNFWCC